MKIGLFHLRRVRVLQEYLLLLLMGVAATLVIVISPSAASAQSILRQKANAMTGTQVGTFDGPTTNINQKPACMANPSSIPARQRVVVTVAVALPVTNLPPSMTFYAARIQPNGSRQNLGSLSASQHGKQTVLQGAIQFQERAAGTIPLQLYYSAASSSSARITQDIAISNVCNLTVTSPIEVNQNGGIQTNGNLGGGNQGRGRNIGPVVEVAGALLGAWINSKQNRSNPPNPDPQQSNNSTGPDQHKPAPTPRPTPMPAPMVTISARGLRLQYPQGWNFHREILNLGGPLNIRNFDQYLGGGVLPVGGAEIDITTVSSNGQTDLNSLAQEELGAASAQGYRVDDRPALLVSYTDNFAPGLNYDNRAAYVAVGDAIYKFFLSYRNGDPRANSYVRDFQQVLASAHFTGNLGDSNAQF